MFAVRLLSRRRGARGFASPRWALLVIPLVLGFCIVSADMLLQLRREAYVRAMEGAGNLLAAVSQDISRNLGMYDLSLRAVQDGLGNAEVIALPAAMRQLVLFDRAATASYFGAVLATDERGMVIYEASTPQPRARSLADRAYFTEQRDHPDAGLFVSGPFRSRRASDGGWVIALSRRISRPDGSFAGVVVGTLRLAYFRDLFAQFRLEPNSAVTLLLTDGTIVARTPWNDVLLGRSVASSNTFARLRAAPNGVFSGKSAVDGIRRINAFTRVPGLPMILDVAQAQRDIYAAWRQQGLVIGATLVLLCAAGILLGLLLTRELRHRALAERAIRHSEAQYRLLAGHATDVIIRVDAALRRTYVSPASLPVLGYPPEALLDQRIGEIIHPDDREPVMARVAQAQRAGQHTEATYRVRHSAGHDVWMESRFSFVPEDRGFTVVLRDVSKRKAAERELEAATTELARLATSDGLTGLANRRCFDERLEQEWKRAARDEVPLSLLLLDVDHFKRFNDEYGHLAGDACLRRVAEVVGGMPRRPGDLAARYGGEELVVLLPGTGQLGAGLLAERLRVAIEGLGVAHAGNPEGGGLVTVSIGAATLLPAGQGLGTGDALVAQADAALYEAKRAGRNRVAPHGPATASPTPPDPPDEALRLRTLAAYRAAGIACGSRELDEITRMAASLFDTADAYINLIDAEEQVFVSATGPLPPPLARRHSLCAHIVAGQGVLVVGDAQADPRFRHNPLVTARGGLRFYAGAPLISPMNGQKLGALCVVDSKPRPSLSSGQIALLSKMAGLAASTMERDRQAASLPA